MWEEVESDRPGQPPATGRSRVLPLPYQQQRQAIGWAIEAILGCVGTVAWYALALCLLPRLPLPHSSVGGQLDPYVLAIASLIIPICVAVLCDRLFAFVGVIASVLTIMVAAPSLTLALAFPPLLQ